MIQARRSHLVHLSVSQPEAHTIYALPLLSECALQGNGTTCCNAPRRLAQSVPTCPFRRTIPISGLWSQDWPCLPLSRLGHSSGLDGSRCSIGCSCWIEQPPFLQTLLSRLHQWQSSACRPFAVTCIDAHQYAASETPSSGSEDCRARREHPQQEPPSEHRRSRSCCQSIGLASHCLSVHEYIWQPPSGAAASQVW